jgi:hypothetical protein
MTLRQVAITVRLIVIMAQITGKTQAMEIQVMAIQATAILVIRSLPMDILVTNSVRIVLTTMIKSSSNQPKPDLDNIQGSRLSGEIKISDELP